MQEQMTIYPYRRVTSEDHPGNPKQKRKKAGGNWQKRITSLSNWFSLEGLFFFLTCLILNRAQVLDGITPCGLAFFAAAISSYRRYLWLLLPAALVGQFTVHALTWQLGANGAVLLVFTLWQIIFPANFAKRWFILPGCVFTCIVAIKVGWILLNSYILYRLITIIVEALLSAGLVIVYLSCMNIIQSKKIPAGLSIEESICTVLFFLSINAGILDLYAYGLSLGNIMSRYFIMMAALVSGSGAGAALGSVLGILPSLVDVKAPLLVGIYAFSGMLAGAMANCNKLGISAGFLLGNLILAVYLLDQTAVVVTLKETAAALLLFWITPNLIIMRLRSVPGWKNTVTNAGDYQRYGAFLAQRVKDIGRAFEELAASLIQHAPAAEQPEENKIQVLYSALAKNVCNGCAIFAVCWERDFYNTYKQILLTYTRLENQGYISEQDLPPDLVKRCGRTAEMAITLRCLYDAYRLDRSWRKKAAESQKMLCNQLLGIAEVLQDMSQSIYDDGYFHDELEVTISNALESAGFVLEEVTAWKEAGGKLEINIRMAACAGGDACGRVLVDLVSDLAGEPFMLEQTTCGYLTGELKCELTLLPLPALQIHAGFAQEAKNQRQICGDSCAMFSLPGGKYALILSDGMGVGAKAARESGAAVALLEKLLLAGFSPCNAVNILNSLLLLQAEEETFATIDLLVIDLYSGEAKFLKIGSAPTFIVRQNTIWSITSNTLPAGIVDSIPLELKTEMLQNGDVIIMLTDGLLEADKKVRDQEQWLVDILQKSLYGSPQLMAEQIMQLMKASVQERRNDDVSVLVAQVVWQTA